MGEGLTKYPIIGQGKGSYRRLATGPKKNKIKKKRGLGSSMTK